MNLKVVTCANIQIGRNKVWLPDKLSDEIPWNKLYVDIIGPYKMNSKRKKNLILKYVKIVEPITGWFEITQYKNKKKMIITNLV